MLKKNNNEDINDYEYIVPIVIVWRPEFILDINKDMLTNEIPRVCTLHELEKVIKGEIKDLDKNEFIIPIKK